MLPKKIVNLVFNIISIIFCLLYFLLPSSANAQTLQQKGITVIPSIMHIDLAVDQPEYELTYINNTNADITLNLKAQDFTELEDSYKINFLNQNDAANYKYSLSSWISFGNKNLQLSPGEKKTVKVFIDKNRITKGGHYASILAEVQQAPTKQINLKAVLSSLLFVRAATGKEIEDGAINTFGPLRDGIEYPDTFILRFENRGNVHVIPYGLIQVFDPLGNLVAKGQLNEGSLDALPESIRTYQIKVMDYQKVLFPGIYTAKISLHFGKTNQKLTSSASFFSQGSLDFIKIGATFLIIVILLIYLKRRNRKT